MRLEWTMRESVAGLTSRISQTALLLSKRFIPATLFRFCVLRNVRKNPSRAAYFAFFARGSERGEEYIDKKPPYLRES
jgi:hypothetical protein